MTQTKRLILTKKSTRSGRSLFQLFSSCFFSSGATAAGRESAPFGESALFQLDARTASNSGSGFADGFLRQGLLGCSLNSTCGNGKEKQAIAAAIAFFSRNNSTTRSGDRTTIRKSNSRQEVKRINGIFSL